MKKGDVEFGAKPVYFVIVAFVLAFIALAFSGHAVSFQKALIENQALVKDSLVLGNAVNCLSKKENVNVDNLEAKRAYKGIIDMGLVNEENIKKCLGDVAVEIGDKRIGKAENGKLILERYVLVEDGGLKKEILRIIK